MKNHAPRVASLTGVLCECLGLDDETTHQLVLSAHLHDIGKAGIPEHIIKKPGSLTPDESRLVRRHPEIGAATLSGMRYETPAIVALRHHEAWDGSGYSDGLQGIEIPFAARVVSVCDVYSALREDRPYRKGMPHEKTLQIMLNSNEPTALCSKFDPSILDVFARYHLLFKRTADQVSDSRSKWLSALTPVASLLAVYP